MSTPFTDDLDFDSSFDDEFEDASTGKYPKMEELCGRLLIMKVVKVELDVPNYKDKTKLEKKMHVDVVVLTGDPINDQPVPIEYDSMWFTAGPLVNSLMGSYKRGSKVLGTLRRFPGKDIQMKYPTPDHVETAVLNREIREADTCWRLAPSTDEDREIAREYNKLKKSNKFG